MLSIKKFNLLLFAVASLTVSACHDHDDDDHVHPDPQPGTVQLEFENRFGNNKLAMPTTVFTTTSQDSVKLQRLMYFISNVKLIKEDGSVYAEPNSYHLVQNAPGSIKEIFKLHDVPAGRYNKIEFSIGVDSAHNQSTDHTIADLKDSHDMTWSWHTGYAFMKLEGKFYNPDSTGFASMLYEIGTDPNYKTLTLPLPQTLIVDTETSSIHLMTDVNKFFGSPNAINIKANPQVKGESQYAAVAAKIAENYSSMFIVHHIHNHGH
ncbi:MAG: hypothetical protein LPJ89_01460 [Hymenobacteraceae bacterium]|nr:hypothetical protein [Hymenobacteraceae bacterium]MDX5395725.1 hypothetical protein [Hymenobacteraceae bacterium]MDX5442430.1 hypothetical protein [Hymenobacteraceae bacterium]MDX5511777.1 hypothetical protein [Hymenobacteraceae bacterium]